MNLFQLATRGVDLSKLPDEEAPRQSVAFEPSTNGGKFSVPTDLNDAFEFAAKDFGIDPDVLRAVAYAESRFNPDVVSGKVKSKTGATGLMQFMPATAKEYGIDPLDPVQSIFGAAAYLRKSLDKFDGDYGKAVASYNAGPNRKDFDASDWDARMPAETQGYLRTVFTAADQLKQGGAATAKPTQAATAVPDTGDETARLAARYKAPDAPQQGGFIQSVGDFFKPTPTSVLESYKPTAAEQQAANAQRLRYGAGPIKGDVLVAANEVASGNANSSSPTVNSVAKQMQKRGDTFTGYAQSKNTPILKEGARDAKAAEFRSAGEWAVDSIASLAQGSVSIPLLPASIIAPGGDTAKTLRSWRDAWSEQESDVLKAQRVVLKERIQSEEGFAGKYATTVLELVTNPALGLSEAIKQVPNYLAVIGASRFAAGAVGTGFNAIEKSSPTLALANALSSGAVKGGAQATAATAGGMAASVVMTSGDAAGDVYETLTDPNKTPKKVWEQNEDYQALIKQGLSHKAAVMQIAEAKARFAAVVVAPLGLFGFMGAESALATKGIAGLAASFGPKAAAKTFGKEIVGENIEEGGTKWGGNVVTSTVDPRVKWDEGVAEAAATATVTSAPMAGLAARSQLSAPPAQAQNPRNGLIAAGLLDPQTYDGGIVGAAGTANPLLEQLKRKPAPTVESQPTTPQVPPTVAPTTPVTPNAAKTQAVDNIAAAIKELEGGTTQAAPVQPGQQTADTGTAPVAQWPADTTEGLAPAGEAAVAGQSESAQSLTDAPLTNEGTTAPTQAVAPAVNPITESMQVARQMADRKGLTAGIQTQLSKGKSIAQATKAMRDDFDEAGIPREEHLTFVHHVSKTLASQPTQQTNPTTQAAPAPDIGAEMAALKARNKATAAVDPAKPTPVVLGRDNTPLSEGGKPFKTKAEAQVAKKLQPMMRVKKEGKGFVLVEKTPAQIAAQANAARRLGGVGAQGKPLSAHEFLASDGGLNISTMADLGFDKNVRVGAKYLFTKTGKTMEGMTEALQQNGYMEGTEQNKAIDLVKLSANGKPQYTAAGWDTIAKAEAEARFEDHLAAQQEVDDIDPFSPASLAGDFDGDDLTVAGYDAAQDQIKLEVNALLAQAEALGIDTDTIRETAFEDTKNESEQTYYERVKSDLTRAINASTGGRSNQATDGNGQRGQGTEAQRTSGVDSREGDGREGAQGTDGEGLTSYTPAEVTARQQATAQAEAATKRAEDAAARAEAAAKQASEIAQRSVAAADTSELGGNAEDNLSGQEGLRFSKKADVQAARTALEKIMRDGVTSPDDLRALLRVPGYSKWAKSTIAGDMESATALRGELQQAFPGSDWKAPTLNDQGIISVYSDWDGFTAQNIDKLTKLADKYDAPIGVRGGAATKQLVNRLDGFGFELYNGLQERADRMPNVMFGMIRPAGGITATTPLFSQATQSPSTPVSTIRQAIAKAYGNLLPRLEGKGLVTLTQTEEEAIAAAAQARADKTGGDVEVIKESLRKSVLASEASDIDVKRSADGNLEGFFDPVTGKSFLIADNLTAESAPATLMHEVGIHRAAEGGGKMGAVIERAGGILRIERNNEFVQRVQSRMDEAGETSNEEAAAYIVTEYEKDRTNAPASVKQWIKDFIADVRAWLFNKGVLISASQLTVADISAVARANARSMARGEKAPGDLRYSRGTNDPMTNNDVVGNQGGRSADDTAPGVLFTDENDNAIVYEREGFRISVNRPGAASYVVLWAKQEVNGKTYWRKAGTLDTNQKTKKVGGVVGEYLGVSSIEIEKAYRAQGLGLEMYRALMANAAPNIAGVISHTPNRVNKQQVPRIYRKLGAFTDGDNQIIPIGRNESTAPDSSGAMFSRPRFSRGAQTQANESVERLATGIASHWDNAPKIVVAFDMNDPRIPEAVRKEDQRQRSGGGQQAQQNLALNAPSPAWMLPASTKTDALVYEIQDQKVDLKRTQEAIKAAGRTITEPFDARMAETLMPGRVAYRTETFLKTEVAPLMEAMAKNNVTQNELSDYLLARHAPERNAQIAKVNPDPDMQDGGAGTNSQGVRMTTQAANDYIAALTTGKRMVLQLLANKIDAITASTRDMLVREGLEKQSTMDAWTGAYKHYVPLFKDEAVESPAHPIGSGMSVTGSASKRAMGSEGEVTNMVAHILMQREAAITRAEKNRVAMSLYGLALSNPNKDVWSTIRPSMSADKIGAELAAMGVDPVEAEQGMQGVPTIRTINAVTGLVQDTPNPMYKRLENALVVKVDGEDRVVLFNAKNADAMRMARALKNQDGLTNFDLAGSMVGTATRYFASINTQYNPAFGMVNVVRDIGGALVNLTTTGIADKKAKVLGDIPAAMKGIARDVRGDQTRTPWSDLWVQFQEDGGRTGYRDLFIDPFKRAEAVQKDLDAMQRDGTASAGRVAHSILDLLDDFNTTLENGVRLSAYKAALDKGMSRPAAAKMARELTVDFNRKGRTGREVGPLYAFFNASVQGTARTIESLKGPAGKKIIAGGLMLGVIQSLMLAAAGFDDDKPQEFVKARSFIIPMGDKKYIAIPLQFGLNALPNTGRVITDLLLTGGKDAGKKTFNAIGEIMGSFNPLGGGNIFTAHGLLTTVAPTVADPLVDLATNTNFADTPIGKDRADWDTRPGAKLARESTQRSVTGQVYIGISKAINAASGGNEFKKGLASPTPEQVQYVFTTTGGGLYRELEKTLNIAGLKADGFEIKSRMIPLGGRFAGEADDQDTQRSRYYRNSERLAALEAELKGFDKADDEAAVKRIETERSDEVDLLGDYKHIRQAITKLNKLAADNINDVEMLKELDAERLELMRELNDSVRKLEKRSELFKRD